MSLPIFRAGRLGLAIALPLLTAVACQHADVEPASKYALSLAGDWHLTATGGGITGQTTPVPADRSVLLRFNPDSTYARVFDSQLQEQGTYRLYRTHWSAGQPDTVLTLQLMVRQPAGNQPATSRYHVTRFQLNELHFNSGVGCGLSEQYWRTPGMDCLPR